MVETLVSLRETLTWRPEINENIWNSLLLFSRELLYIHINFPPCALTVQTAKKHKESPFLHKRRFCQGRHVGVTQGEKSQIQDAVFSKRKTLPGWKLVKRYNLRSSST